MFSSDRFAGIQYVGVPGISEACAQAVQRMLQYGDHIASATLLTGGREHCFLLVVDEGDRVAVKRGFASGYSGEGPKALSRVLKLLLDHGADVGEVDVDVAILDRVDASALTERDIDVICSSKAVRPTRVYDYIHAAQPSSASLGIHWSTFPAVVPFAIIDKRIADLALRLREEPNGTLLKGFRRLEDTIRQRAASNEHGAKLFSQAFQGEKAALTWEEVQPSELVGRVNLFTGAYMAHRNPRAHQELQENPLELLSEFLLLNHLFKLESQAVPRAPIREGASTPNEPIQPTPESGAADG